MKYKENKRTISKQLLKISVFRCCVSHQRKEPREKNKYCFGLMFVQTVCFIITNLGDVIRDELLYIMPVIQLFRFLVLHMKITSYEIRKKYLNYKIIK